MPTDLTEDGFISQHDSTLITTEEAESREAARTVRATLLANSLGTTRHRWAGYLCRVGPAPEEAGTAVRDTTEFALADGVASPHFRNRITKALRNRAHREDLMMLAGQAPGWRPVVSNQGLLLPSQRQGSGTRSYSELAFCRFQTAPAICICLPTSWEFVYLCPLTGHCPCERL